MPPKIILHTTLCQKSYLADSISRWNQLGPSMRGKVPLYYSPFLSCSLGSNPLVIQICSFFKIPLFIFPDVLINLQ